MAAACSSDDNILQQGRKSICFDVIHPSAVTRAGATAFDVGDRIGVFVTADTALLQISGNKVNNEAVTYDGTQWKTRRQFYWDDGKFNIYAYYPRIQTISLIDDCPVSVAVDQSLDRTTYKSSNIDTPLSAYEASDILYAKVEGFTATDAAVPLRFAHTMSRLVVRLIKGEDFEGELPTKVDVYIHNTVTEATINLNNGIVTNNIKANRQSIKARQESDYTYAAIIVPQRIPNRVPLLEVEINGVSYLCESNFTFKPGMQHIINFILDKNPNQSLINIGGEVEQWQ